MVGDGMTAIPPLPGDDVVPAWAETGAGYGGRVPRMRPDLPTWLREQIADDRRLAVRAGGETWKVAHHVCIPDWCPPSDCEKAAECAAGECEDCRIDGSDISIYDEGGHDNYQAEHIARWDPARVLAECDAKEAILDDHEPVVDGTQSSWTWFEGSESKSERILRQLALPYSARPGYREEWKP